MKDITRKDGVMVGVFICGFAGTSIPEIGWMETCMEMDVFHGIMVNTQADRCFI